MLFVTPDHSSCIHDDVEARQPADQVVDRHGIADINDTKGNARVALLPRCSRSLGLSDAGGNSAGAEIPKGLRTGEPNAARPRVTSTV